MKKNTSWNILLLVFLNAELPGDAGKDSLSDFDARYAASIVERIKLSVPEISGGLISINSIDFFTVEQPITVLDSGYNNTNLEAVGGILDEYLKKGDYDHLIMITPLRKVAQGWAGLGGMEYKGVGVTEVHYRSRAHIGIPALPHFPEAVFVHELLHYIERISQSINPATAGLHDNGLFGFNDGSEDEWRAWYVAYMRNMLPEGRGIDPRAYEAPRLARN